MEAEHAVPKSKARDLSEQARENTATEGVQLDAWEPDRQASPLDRMGGLDDTVRARSRGCGRNRASSTLTRGTDDRSRRCRQAIATLDVRIAKRLLVRALLAADSRLLLLLLQLLLVAIAVPADRTRSRRSLGGCLLGRALLGAARLHLPLLDVAASLTNGIIKGIGIIGEVDHPRRRRRGRGTRGSRGRSGSRRRRHSGQRCRRGTARPHEAFRHRAVVGLCDHRVHVDSSELKLVLAILADILLGLMIDNDRASGDGTPAIELVQESCQGFPRLTLSCSFLPRESRSDLGQRFLRGGANQPGLALSLESQLDVPSISLSVWLGELFNLSGELLQNVTGSILGGHGNLGGRGHGGGYEPRALGRSLPS